MTNGIENWALTISQKCVKHVLAEGMSIGTLEQQVEDHEMSIAGWEDVTYLTSRCLNT